MAALLSFAAIFYNFIYLLCIFVVLGKDLISNFFDVSGEAKYMNILQEVANRKIRSNQIELDDLINYKDLDEEFLIRVTENTRRYVEIFSDASDELIPEPTETFSDEDHDILKTQRSDVGRTGEHGCSRSTSENASRD